MDFVKGYFLRNRDFSWLFLNFCCISPWLKTKYKTQIPASFCCCRNSKREEAKLSLLFLNCDNNKKCWLTYVWWLVFSQRLIQWKKHKFTQRRLPRNTQTSNWHPLMCTYQDEKPLLFVLLLRFGLAFFYKFWNLILRACVDVTYGTEIFVKKHRSPHSWR